MLPDVDPPEVVNPDVAPPVDPDVEPDVAPPVEPDPLVAVPEVDPLVVEPPEEEPPVAELPVAEPEVEPLVEPPVRVLMLGSLVVDPPDEVDPPVDPPEVLLIAMVFREVTVPVVEPPVVDRPVVEPPVVAPPVNREVTFVGARLTNPGLWTGGKAVSVLSPNGETMPVFGSAPGMLTAPSLKALAASAVVSEVSSTDVGSTSIDSSSGGAHALTSENVRMAPAARRGRADRLLGICNMWSLWRRGDDWLFASGWPNVERSYGFEPARPGIWYRLGWAERHAITSEFSTRGGAVR